MLRRASVATVLTVALVALTTALLGGLGAANYATYRDHGWERLRADLALHANQLQVGLELPVWNIDRPQIERILDGLQDAPEIQSVMVDAADRTHARIRDERGQWQASDRPLATEGLIVEKRPITANGESVGSLILCASPRVLEQDLRAARRAIFLAIVAVDLLLVLSLYLVLWKTVLGPLRGIEHYAGRVSAGDAAGSTLPHTGFIGELARLRTSLETMVRQLDDRYEQLRAEVARRQEHEAALLRSEQQYRDVVDFSPMGIYQARLDGTVLMANRAAARILGCTPEEALRLNMARDVFADPEERDKRVKSILEGGPIRALEVRARRRDGSTLWVEGWSHAVRDDAGELLYFETFFHDITARRAAQDALGASEERYRLLFEGNPIPMLVYDLESLAFVAVNQAAVEQYGYSRRQLLQLSLPDLAVPGDPLLPPFLATRFNPRPDLVHVGERTQRRRDGSVIDVDVTSLSLTLGGRRARLMLARDITAERRTAEDRARMQETLRRHEQMSAMGALVAGVAHEVRNPLFSISATVEALEAELEGQAQYAELADLLRVQVARLTRLMHDLLDYGKPPVPKIAPAELSEVIRRALRSCTALAKQLDVQMHAELPSLPPLPIDAGRIEQVFENLLSNAVQHSPPGGRVHVKARVLEGGAVELTVEDEGPGIDPADLPRLFEPFFSRRAGGTGLGLPIIQRIVEAHGGHVHAANREGKGAVFVVSLPAVPPSAANTESGHVH